jgi:hypothetical protein
MAAIMTETNNAPVIVRCTKFLFMRVGVVCDSFIGWTKLIKKNHFKNRLLLNRKVKFFCDTSQEAFCDVYNFTFGGKKEEMSLL